MWKKFYLILFLFFGSVLFSTLFLNQNSASAHSVDKPPVFSEEDKQSIVRQYQSYMNYEPDFIKNANIFWLVYKTANSYHKDDLYHVVAYTCVDKQYTGQGDSGYSEKYYQDCGSYLEYDKNSGVYTIKIKAVYIMSSGSYYKRTNKLTYGGFSRYSSDYYQTISSSDDPNYYTIYLDQHNKINQFNIKPQSHFEQSNSGSGGIAGLDFGAFAKGIVNGITDFFKPLVDLINMTFKIITDFITGFFEKVAEFVKNLFKIDFSIVKEKSENLQKTINNSGGLGKLIFLPVNLLGIVMTHNTVTCSNFSVVIAKDYVPISFDLCHAPEPLILIARSVLLVSILFILINRIRVFVSILFGSRYSWVSKGDDE